MSSKKLTTVAVLEVIPAKDGVPADKKVLVEPEVLVTSLSGKAVREEALIRHAAKLKGKDPCNIEVVCSDFLQVG